MHRMKLSGETSCIHLRELLNSTSQRYNRLPGGGGLESDLVFNASKFHIV